MRRVGVGVQEMDDQAFAAHGQEPRAPHPQLRLVERSDHLSRHVHALVDLDAPLARDQRLEGAGHAVGSAACAGRSACRGSRAW